MFRKKDFVFLLCQDKMLIEDGETQIKDQADDYVLASLKTLFGSKKIAFSDIYTNNSTDNVTFKTVTILSTTTPHNKYFLPLIYEIYAFVKTDDDGVFSYKYSMKKFGSESNTITVYKFKI